jgi:ribosomal protein S18 acetylase RimI-like enzyme
MIASSPIPIDFPAKPAGPALKVPGVPLRACRGEDYRFLLRLYRQTREAELAHSNWPEELRQAFCAQQFAAQHADWTARFAGAHFLLMMRRGQPVGRLYVLLGEGEIHLIDIAILAARHRQGLGSGVLRALQELAAKRAVPLRLAVLRDNGRAQALYRRLGFVIESEAPDRLRMVWRPVL